MHQQIIERYALYLNASDRLPETIKLRLRHIAALARIRDLLTVTRDDLEAIQAATRDLAPETRKSVLASWRLFFAWAHTRGHRPDNPTAELPPVRGRQRVPRVATDTAVIQALPRASLPERAMILLAREGWLRLSEIARSHPSQRTGDRMIIRGKGDKERTVYLTEALASTLDQIEHAQGRAPHYLPGIRVPHQHPTNISKTISRLTGYNPHALRHAGATAAWRSTRDLRAIQQMLGHASIATTQRYLHVHDDDLRAVAVAASIQQRPTPGAPAGRRDTHHHPQPGRQPGK